MRKLLPLFLLGWISTLATGCSGKAETLFNPALQNWEAYGEAQWAFEGQTLVGRADSTAGFVMTNAPYGNYRLELEFLPDATINSGIFIHCPEAELSATDCYEINIWDRHPRQEYRTGAIVTRVTPLAQVHTLNRWNAYKVAAGPDSLKVWVNDTLTAVIPRPELHAGRIGLQASGMGTIRFRNVHLYPIMPD